MKKTTLLSAVLLSCAVAVASAQGPLKMQKADVLKKQTAAVELGEGEQIISSCQTTGDDFGSLGGINQKIQLRIMQKLPAEYAGQIAGNKITKVVYALGAKDQSYVTGFSDVKVFVTDDPSQESPASQAGGENTFGWHTVALDNPFTIDGKKDVYIGYEGTLAAGAYGIGIGTGNSNNSVMYQFYQGEWADGGWNPDYGAALVYGIATGDKNFTKGDLEITSITLPDFSEAGSDISVSVGISNNGYGQVENASLTWGFQGSEMKTEAIDEPVGPGQWTFTVPVAVPAVEKGKLAELTFEASIASTSLTEDDTDNNKATAKGKAYGEGMSLDAPRMVLVEQFTTNLCVFCPMGHEALEAAIKGYEDKVIKVAHHIGYESDRYTLAYQSQLARWMYNGHGAMYAPACMVDRVYDAEWSSASNGQGASYAGPAADPRVEGKVRYYVDKLSKEPTFASINIEVEGDSINNNVKVTVSGKVVKGIIDKPSINLVITEDSLRSSQAGANGIWYNNNTARIVPTGFEGKLLTLDEEGNYTYTTTVKIEKSIAGTQGVKVASNHHKWNFVAFIANGTVKSDPQKAQVLNSAILKRPLADFIPSGVNNATADEVAVYEAYGELHIDGEFDAAQIYTTDGRLVKMVNGGESVTSLQELANNMYVVKVVSGDKTTVAKILLNR